MRQKRKKVLHKDIIDNKMRIHVERVKTKTNKEEIMEKENILGTEKIGKLIRKFSIPCIISLVVNSLYNIVDQIFIGWGVGYLGNGATNVVFPITMICLAFALMLGDGTSAYLSLKLGEKKRDEAKKGVANSIINFLGTNAKLFSTVT